MTVVSTHRGHQIVEVEPAVWVYGDTLQRVADNPDRVCGYCGLKNTREGHDGCLGTLPDVMNACCGHGDPSAAYEQKWPAWRAHKDTACQPNLEPIKAARLRLPVL